MKTGVRPQVYSLVARALCGGGPTDSLVTFVQLQMRKKHPHLWWSDGPPNEKARSTTELNKDHPWCTFLHSDRKSLQLSWTGHARTVFRDGNTLYVFDPWMQTIDKGNQKGNPGFRFIQKALDTLSENGSLKVKYTLVFTPQAKDQGPGDKSCTMFSYIRGLMLDTFGWKGASMPIPPELPSLVARIVQHYKALYKAQQRKCKRQ
jgi:hypothetical protein